MGHCGSPDVAGTLFLSCTLEIAKPQGPSKATDTAIYSQTRQTIAVVTRQKLSSFSHDFLLAKQAIVSTARGG